MPFVIVENKMLVTGINTVAAAVNMKDDANEFIAACFPRFLKL